MSTVMGYNFTVRPVAVVGYGDAITFSDLEVEEVCRRAMEVDPERVQGQKGQFLTAIVTYN